MNRIAFLDALKARLWALPEEDRKCSLDYYSEMIDDRMEEGLSEEEAVAAIGDLEEIVKQILEETPRPPQVVKPAETKKNKDNTKVWLIILLIVGSPVWIPLAAGLLSSALSVYVSLWAVVISLYATFVALVAAAVGCIVGSFFMLGGASVIVALGAALVCAGLSILVLLLSNLAAKGMVKLTKLCVQGVKSLFNRKERTV